MEKVSQAAPECISVANKVCEQACAHPPGRRFPPGAAVREPDLRKGQSPKRQPARVLHRQEMVWTLGKSATLLSFHFLIRIRKWSGVFLRGP